jgi:hypothetical protein
LQLSCNLPSGWGWSPEHARRRHGRAQPAVAPFSCKKCRTPLITAGIPVFAVAILPGWVIIQVVTAEVGHVLPVHLFWTCSRQPAHADRCIGAASPDVEHLRRWLQFGRGERRRNRKYGQVFYLLEIAIAPSRRLG